MLLAYFYFNKNTLKINQEFKILSMMMIILSKIINRKFLRLYDVSKI